MTDVSCLADLALLTYGYNVVVGFYCLFIFTWWLLLVGRPSAWYMYVMGLILSIVVSCGFQMTARYLLLTGNDLYDDLLRSFPWSVKSWVGSFTLTLVAAHASVRFFLRKGEE